jgi:hypothetical protein
MNARLSLVWVVAALGCGASAPARVDLVPTLVAAARLAHARGDHATEAAVTDWLTAHLP